MSSDGVTPTKVLEADEKASGSLPGYDSGSGNAIRGDIHEESWATRNGLNAESFKKKEYGRGVVELDRAMSTRHLHMIAIGGSIGAGFFVGSGGALSKGVSICCDR